LIISSVCTHILSLLRHITRATPAVECSRIVVDVNGEHKSDSYTFGWRLD